MIKFNNFCCIIILFNWASKYLIQPAVLSVPSDDFCTKVRPSVIFAGFQASAFFWDITQLIVAIPYRNNVSGPIFEDQEIQEDGTSALFWDIAQLIVVIPYRDNVWGPIFEDQEIQEDGTSALFWDITQLIVVIPYRDNVSGPILEDQEIQEDSDLHVPKLRQLPLYVA